jgi:hypothetical protein
VLGPPVPAAPDPPPLLPPAASAALPVVEAVVPVPAAVLPVGAALLPPLAVLPFVSVPPHAEAITIETAKTFHSGLMKPSLSSLLVVSNEDEDHRILV